MSLKIRRSRGGWVLVRKVCVFESVPPSNDGKIKVKSYFKEVIIKKGLTRGAAKNVRSFMVDYERKVRKSLLVEIRHNFKPEPLSLADNYREASDSLPNGVSGLGIVPEIQPEDF